MTTLKADITALLEAEGIKVSPRSLRPPFAQVNFGGSAELDPSLRRGSATVWVVVTWGQDPQPLAARVWRALLRSGRYMPQEAVSQAPGPGPYPEWDVILISVEATTEWWQHQEE